MDYENDYVILDLPEVSQFIFFPRKDRTAAPANSSDHVVFVAEGVAIACRLYFCNQTVPSLLYFHGNGEVVCDHDHIAPTYNRWNMNLFVADYRGYGASSGSPSFSSLLVDAHGIFKAFKEILWEENYSGPIYVMGRSLGSIPAVELALHYPDQIKGVIIESGMASMSTLMSHMGLSGSGLELSEGFPNLIKIRNIRLPTLIMHGEDDSLIPVTEACALYEASAASDKHLFIIPGAEHNDIMLVGGEGYFDEISRFVHNDRR